MKFIVLWALWSGLFGHASAQAEIDAGQLERNADRTRITAERQQLEVKFNAAEAVCFRAFFANACRERLRPAHLAAMADLRRQEVLIMEVERKISAADQLLKTEEKLNLQRQEQAEKALQVQQDATDQAARALQRQADRGSAADQAAVNQANVDLRQTTRGANALELASKRAQAAANVEATRLRQESAAKNLAERQQRLQQASPPTGKSLPAYP
jgi:colicin import membrane protein